jgi:DNA polymerase elongation subunit (family B)
MSSIKRVFWDIETSPCKGYFWSPGFKVRIPHDNITEESAIICIAWKWEDHRRTFSLTWDGVGDDKTMIEDFLERVSSADELVAHYGDSFDIKWFHGQCLKHRLSPIPEVKTVDTCRIARSKFKLNSYKLDYIAKILFGEGKQDAPFQLWVDVMEEVPGALDQMVEYCKQDVRLLERTFKEMERFTPPMSHEGVMRGLPRWTCPYCGSTDIRRKKQRTTTKGMLQHSMMCNQCRRHFTIANFLYEQFKDYRRFQVESEE